MKLLYSIKEHKFFYLLLVLPLAYYIIFLYVPMYGVILAFKDFDYSKGIIGSPWIGFANFTNIFAYSDFWRSVKNTLIIAFLRLSIGFPSAIILALLLNEVRKQRMKKLLQTVYTFPHFLSWIIVAAMFRNIFADAGIWNQICQTIGISKNSFLTNPATFPLFLALTDLWKEVGWGTIIYLAAIAGINPQLYESAKIDGAGRMKQAIYITWPAIRSTATILLILAMGSIMSSGGGGFDQVFNLYNPGVYDTGDILDTYIYRRTFMEGASFGTSTAVGLFKSVINAFLIIFANKIANLYGEEGLF